MNWAYPIFVLLLSGFGLVYLVWPVNEVVGTYGYFAVNSSLLLCTLSLTRAAMVNSGGWEKRICQGFSGSFWLWFFAGVVQALEYLRKQSDYSIVYDFLWVTGYVPVFIGLYPRFRQTGSLGKSGARSIMIILLAAYVMVLYLYLIPHVDDPKREIHEKALDGIYFSFNVLMLLMVLTISRDLSKMKSPLATPFHVITAATVILTLSDLMLSYFTNRESFMYQLMDLPYFLVYFLFFQAGRDLSRHKMAVVV